MSWERHTAARTMVMEARGEPLPGQEAIVWVLRHRLATGRWGKSLASVCLWHAQFSGWWCPRGAVPFHDPNFAYACGLQDDDPMVTKMLAILDGVLAADMASDPIQGATHYYATSISEPSWVAGAIFTVQIGRHRFYKGVK